jgi:hypothetical protein
MSTQQVGARAPLELHWLIVAILASVRTLRSIKLIQHIPACVRP